MRISYSAGFLTGYIAAVATIAGVLVKLAFSPPDRWLGR